MDGVHEVVRQVAAGGGVNYRVTASLTSTCVIPWLNGTSESSIIFCERVNVFKPPPHSCNDPDPNNPKCLELNEEAHLSVDSKLGFHDLSGGKCSSRQYLPAERDLTEVMSFVKQEARNLLLQEYEVC